MNDYYCIDVEFPDVDFGPYYIKSSEINKKYHAHLYADGNEIELRIYYESKTYFGEKISMWSQKIGWDKFGKYIRVSNENQNDFMHKLDLSGAKLCGVKYSTPSSVGETQYVTIKLDSVKFYWNPSIDQVNTAEFYLDDVGFRIVEPYYSILFGSDGKFNMTRYDGMRGFYNLDKSKFRPEFNTYSKDNKNNREATVVKEPKIKFKFTKPTTEEEAVFYGDIVSLVASFYHHIDIKYSFRRIRLPEHTIEIKSIPDKNCLERRGHLWAWGIHWDFDKFLKSKWQKSVIKNYKLLSKSIAFFNQALLVDSNSEFLIRFHIIEICNNLKPKAKKINLIKNGNSKKKIYQEALTLLLKNVNPKDHKDFKNKWTSLSGKLEYKPMQSPLIQFLESQNLKTEDFPISIYELKKLRDDITHGSIDKIDDEQLRKANKFLYRINGILILNLMGIKEWTLNLDLT